MARRAGRDMTASAAARRHGSARKRLCVGGTGTGRRSRSAVGGRRSAVTSSQVPGGHGDSAESADERRLMLENSQLKLAVAEATVQLRIWQKGAEIYNTIRPHQTLNNPLPTRRLPGRSLAHPERTNTLSRPADAQTHRSSRTQHSLGHCRIMPAADRPTQSPATRPRFEQRSRSKRANSLTVKTIARVKICATRRRPEAANAGAAARCNARSRPALHNRERQDQEHRRTSAKPSRGWGRWRRMRRGPGRSNRSRSSAGGRASGVGAASHPQSLRLMRRTGPRRAPALRTPRLVPAPA